MMAVYVDSMRAPLGRMVMCHMVADTLEELHQMAEKLGVRKYFQAHTKYPHYNICKSKRALAIEFGAVECDLRTALEKAKLLKAESESCTHVWVATDNGSIKTGSICARCHKKVPFELTEQAGAA